MGRSRSLLPNIHYRKAAARKRQQLAQSGRLTFEITSLLDLCGGPVE